MALITSTEFNAAIGENIRRFRTLQHMTQQTLANMLSRSPACISKYENGAIAIDLHTLYQIAEALKIPPTLLFPQAETDGTAAKTCANDFPAFFRHPTLFLYTLSKKTSNIVTSVMELYHDRMEATIYYAVKDTADYKNSDYVMLGTVWTSEANIRMHFTNPLLKSDFIFMCFHTTDLIAGNGMGFFTALNYLYQFSAAKCCISTAPIRDFNGLKEKLSLSREELQLLKKQSELLL